MATASAASALIDLGVACSPRGLHAAPISAGRARDPRRATGGTRGALSADSVVQEVLWLLCASAGGQLSRQILLGAACSPRRCANNTAFKCTLKTALTTTPRCLNPPF